jgi:arabinan endo-1,5-alpha-L-arabinosidase
MKRPDMPRQTAIRLPLWALVVLPWWLPTAGFAQAPTPASAPAQAFDESAWLERLGSRGVRTHDPSTVVKCKDEYWVFYTGYGIPSFHSKDLVHWEAGPRVFTNPPPWVAQAVPGNRGGMDCWAPDILRVDNRYLLYYSVSVFGRNTSAIGLATSPTLNPNDPHFDWTDQGLVIQSAPGVEFNTIDPSVFRDADGSLWLAFGSFWSGIRLVQLDPRTGKRLALDSPLYSLAHADAIEAACLTRQNGWYYLFVNWGQCCRGTNSTYQIRAGRSDKITGPYVDKAGVNMLLGGGNPVLSTTGPLIGPGHAGLLRENGTNWLSCHFYDRTRRGQPTLALLPLRWDADGWPQVLVPPHP